MALQHVDIGDADRHEPKHADTAVNKTVCMSNGDGTTSFNPVNYNDLVGVPTFSVLTLSNSGFSTAASQLPSAVNTPLQVEFGAGSVGTDVTISSLGLVTFNTAGKYLVMLDLNVSRTAAAGIAEILVRTLVNTTQVGNSFGVSMDNNLSAHHLYKPIIVSVSALDTFKVEFIRDSTGINNGGLYKFTTSLAGWTDIPSAGIRVYKVG